jgi:hypothetical protein
MINISTGTALIRLVGWAWKCNKFKYIVFLPSCLWMLYLRGSVFYLLAYKCYIWGDRYFNITFIGKEVKYRPPQI